MPDTVTKKKAHIVSGFNDAGTGESFVAGATPMIESGAFENYKAAGLVTEASAAKRTPAPTARKPRKTAATPAPDAAPDAEPAADPAAADPVA